MRLETEKTPLHVVENPDMVEMSFHEWGLARLGNSMVKLRNPNLTLKYK